MSDEQQAPQQVSVADAIDSIINFCRHHQGEIEEPAAKRHLALAITHLEDADFRIGAAWFEAGLIEGDE